MKEKIKIILIILVAISFVMFCLAYTFRLVIDYGCSSPNLFSQDKEGTAIEQLASVSFLGIRCILWNRMFQFQENF
ncbi:hypothetical protein KJ853_03830 [Patescibacteria group bacterium]|nr:hypothetical protein [Patescibacteria group bacterium]